MLASEPLQEGPFASRLSRNVGAKSKIAHLAAQLLKPRDSLFIDTGTTTLHLADQLVDLPGLVIITNSLKIAARLGGNPEHQIFLAGGPTAAMPANASATSRSTRSGGSGRGTPS